MNDMPAWLGPVLIAVGVLLFVLAPVISTWMTYRMGW